MLFKWSVIQEQTKSQINLKLIKSILYTYGLPIIFLIRHTHMGLVLTGTVYGPKYTYRIEPRVYNIRLLIEQYTSSFKVEKVRSFRGLIGNRESFLVKQIGMAT